MVEKDSWTFYILWKSTALQVSCGTRIMDIHPKFGMLEEELDKTIRERLQTALPSNLFHYTDAFGFNGILSSLKFNATSIYDLADSKEFKHGLRLAKSVLEEEEKSHRRLRPFFRKVRGSLDTQQRWFRLYVACFCSSDKNLKMWKSYARSQYCIAFDTANLGPFPQPWSSVAVANIVDQKFAWLSKSANLDLTKVEYSKRRQIQLIQEILKKTSSLYEDVGSEHHGRLAADVAHFILRCLCSFKRGRFSKEQEWRFVRWRIVGCQDDQELLRLTAQGIAIPYSELDTLGKQPRDGKLFLAEVQYGRKMQKLRAQDSIRSFLVKNGFDNCVKIKRSLLF